MVVMITLPALLVIILIAYLISKKKSGSKHSLGWGGFGSGSIIIFIIASVVIGNFLSDNPELVQALKISGVIIGIAIILLIIFLIVVVRKKDEEFSGKWSKALDKINNKYLKLLSEMPKEYITDTDLTIGIGTHFCFHNGFIYTLEEHKQSSFMSIIKHKMNNEGASEEDIVNYLIEYHNGLAISKIALKDIVFWSYEPYLQARVKNTNPITIRIKSSVKAFA